MFLGKKNFSFSLVPKLILVIGLILLVTLSVWGYFILKYFERKNMDDVVKATDRLCNTILLGTYNAMMVNSRNDIKQIITNIARQEEIENIRLYNKKGEIKYTNNEKEIDRTVDIKSKACDICHKTTPPLLKVDLVQRARIFQSPLGHRLLGIISPIYNEPGCATDNCHVHPKGQKTLGALDLVVSLKSADREILNYQKKLMILGFFSFIFACGFIIIFLIRTLNHPIKTLIKGTREIGQGDYDTYIDIQKTDEMGLVADAINKMTKDILVH
jgi:histidine kinase